MQCDSFMHRLQDALDSRVDPASDALLAQHAERCPDCKARLADWTAVDAMWSGSDARPKRWRIGPLTALAATIVAGLLGTWMLLGLESVDERVAETATAPVSPAVVSIRAPADDQDLEQVLTTVASRELSRWADDAWRPVVEGLRPVTGSLSAAVRAFQPASLHLGKGGEERASGQARSASDALGLIDDVSALV